MILDIFAQHARSAEGKLQVELAQLNYRLPRLQGLGRGPVAHGWRYRHPRGPGETALEVERRGILRRIQRVKKDLADLERTRRLKRKQRNKTGIPVVALVGYTNAGKSTVLRSAHRCGGAHRGPAVLDAGSHDPTPRAVPGRQALMTDTVGFVRKLPHQLVESFNSTLEEVGEATMLLHIVDASGDPERQIDAVNTVLNEIGVTGKPTLLVLNKIDLISEVHLDKLRGRFPHAVFCAAGLNRELDGVVAGIEAELSRLKVEVELNIPFERGDVVARVHDEGDVVEETYSEHGTRVTSARSAARISRRFRPLSDDRGDLDPVPLCDPSGG